MVLLSLVAVLLASVLPGGQVWANEVSSAFEAQDNPYDDAPATTDECWNELRSFYPSFGNPLDYCRGHFKFEPGALDCYSFTDQVCWVFSPTTQSWAKIHTVLPPTVFPCPRAPKPPQCPEFLIRRFHFAGL